MERQLFVILAVFTACAELEASAANTPALALSEGWLTNGLVAFYPFKGNARDESGRGNDGLVHGASLTTDHLGNASKAYSFDGVTNYIDVGNPVGDSPTDLTQTAWVKILKMTPFDRDTIITKRQADNVGAGWPSLCIGGARWHPHRAILLIDIDYYQDGDVVGTSTIPENTWVFLCGIKRGNVYQIYVNGKWENSRADTHATLRSPYTMHFMHHGAFEQHGDGGFCNGVLGEVRIYDRALSGSEVRELYAIGFRSLAASLEGRNVVLSWPTNASSLSLFATTNLTQAAIWTAVTPPPVPFGNRYFVTNFPADPLRFFRLGTP